MNPADFVAVLLLVPLPLNANFLQHLLDQLDVAFHSFVDEEAALLAVQRDLSHKLLQAA